MDSTDCYTFLIKPLTFCIVHDVLQYRCWSFGFDLVYVYVNVYKYICAYISNICMYVSISQIWLDVCLKCVYLT